MSKAKHECAACGALFVTITEHMSHYIIEHDHEYRNGKNGSKKLYRKVSCWRCAKQMPRREDGRYRCECGFRLPRKEKGTNVWIYDDLPDV